MNHLIKDHDNHHDESKTMTHRFSKLPDDGDPWAPNNVLKSGAKEKHQLIIEPHREKTGFLPRRKQRRRSASR